MLMAAWAKKGNMPRAVVTLRSTDRLCKPAMHDGSFHGVQHAKVAIFYA